MCKPNTPNKKPTMQAERIETPLLHLRNGSSLRYSCISDVVGTNKVASVHLTNGASFDIPGYPRLILQEALKNYEAAHPLGNQTMKQGLLPLVHMYWGLSFRYADVMAVVACRSGTRFFFSNRPQPLLLKDYEATQVQEDIKVYEIEQFQVTHHESYDPDQ